jgi:hypothetical protein
LDKFLVGGRFDVTCFDAEGNEKWREDVHNLVVTEGLNHLLDVVFHGTSAIATWYIGLIHSTGYSAIAAGDTLASHAGWEESSAYSGNRKEWTEGAASSGSMTNGTSVDFAINGTATMKGAFLCSAASGTTGTLFCAALFSGGDRSVINGDTLKVTYTLTASSS